MSTTTIRRDLADNGVRANGKKNHPAIEGQPMSDEQVHRGEAEAEAEQRYPLWDTPSADYERHRAGYWAFIAGASWASHHSGPTA